MSRTTLDSTMLSPLSYTGLSPSLVCFSKTILLDSIIIYVVRTPVVFLLLVWALSISLATTLEIDFSFSSYGYLDVSVPHVPFSYTTLLIYGYLGFFSQMSFLIRISTALGIFAPPRSFSQLITSFFGSWCLGIHPTLLVA